MRSRMSLYVAGLSRQSSKEGKAAMLLGDIDLGRFMIHLKQVEEDKLKDREESKDKRAMIVGEEFRKLKNDANQSSLPQKQKGPGSPSASALIPENKDGGSGELGSRAQSSSVAPPNGMVPRGAISSTGGRANRLYAIKCHQEQEDSLDVVTGGVNGCQSHLGGRSADSLSLYFGEDLAQCPFEQG
ncbi:uncharacterized protein LOC125843114 [Solanum stenotomum]|uniref:uncharacterized protein LOC125843114 n=1 Tax=Solanum stenotomum TaxID=172797 RepID=UPI0020D11D87|nr:uncharacterized protein LOC125843114 [Solanum stenotomum]